MIDTVRRIGRPKTALSFLMNNLRLFDIV